MKHDQPPRPQSRSVELPPDAGLEELMVLDESQGDEGNAEVAPAESKPELQAERRKLFEALKLIFAGDDTLEQGVELLSKTNIIIKSRHLKVTDFIGRGKFGFVIEVTDIDRPGKTMALKLSAPFDRSAQHTPEDEPEDERAQKAYDEAFKMADHVRSLVREIEATKKLTKLSDNSPYPKYYDAQIIPDPDNLDHRISALLMEKIEGENLEGLISEGLQGDPEVLLDIAKQFAQAVDFTHRAGFLHRDIKPENALIDTNDRIRLIDLGFAVRWERPNINKVVYREPVDGIVAGSEDYENKDEMNPLSIEHDVYTLGRTFQQLLVGDKFRNLMNFGITTNKISEPVLREFINLTYRMINFKPDRRPTMPQVLAELDKIESQLQLEEIKKQIAASALR